MAASTKGWVGWSLCGVGPFLLGLSMGAENPNEMGYGQTVTPGGLQGRVNATRRSINRSMIVIGAPLGGLLADSLSYRPMLLATALGFLTTATAFGRNARLVEISPISGVI